jgi:putative DNA primase/helicase
MDWNFEPLTAEECAEAPRIADFEEVKVPIVPVPASALPLSFKHPAYGNPTETYPYVNAAGQLVGYMARFADKDGNKHTYPLTYCSFDGREAWRAEGFPTPSPLFNLTELIARPDAPVLVVRGERNVEAAKQLFPQFVATCSPSDDGQIGKAEWNVLKDRTVIIIAHADAREQSFTEVVSTHAYKGGAKTVSAIPASSIAKYVWTDTSKAERVIIPASWDVAKAVEDGWTVETLAKQIGDISLLQPEPKPLIYGADGEATFRLCKHGVEAWVVTAKDQYWLHICGVMEMIAEARTADGNGWAKIFRLTNSDGGCLDVDVPLTLIAGDGVKMREILHDHGLYIKTGKVAREQLLEFIAQSSANHRFIRVDTVGWFDNVFVTANGVIGKHVSGQDIHYVKKRGVAAIGKTAGSLDAWRQEVAKPCEGNTRLVFALSAAFVGPLLKISNGESTIFHLVGQSSKGKTTALTVAGSVWGGGDGKPNIGNWRATANGLEWAAAGHNDALYCLDEISQIKGSELKAASYMLANGSGKQRALSSGGAQTLSKWRIIILSSGEMDLEAKIRDDDPRQNVTAGQKVRLIDLTADAGKGNGLFEELHDFPDGRSMAEGLGQAAITNYGHAGIAFVENVSADTEGFVRIIEKRLMQGFAALKLPADVDGQVARVAKKFLLVGVAGEIAIKLGILPWPEGEALTAAKKLFGEWLKNRGGVGASEEAHVLEQVRYFLQKNATRFASEEKDQHGPKSAASAGFIQDVSGKRYFCFPSETWKRDVCAGLDPRFVTHILQKHDYLSSERSRPTKSVNYAGATVRVYAIKETILTEKSGSLPIGFRVEAQNQLKKLK